MYQLRGTLFYKLDSFGNPYTDDRKPFKNLDFFDFESICVEDEKIRETEITI